VRSHVSNRRRGVNDFKRRTLGGFYSGGQIRRGSGRRNPCLVKIPKNNSSERQQEKGASSQLERLLERLKDSHRDNRRGEYRS